MVLFFFSGCSESRSCYLLLSCHLSKRQVVLVLKNVCESKLYTVSNTNSTDICMYTVYIAILASGPVHRCR